MARGRLIATILAVVLLAAACGRPDSGFDIHSLESAIPASLVPDDPSVVTDVSCPAPATSEATTVACGASVAGVPIEVSAAISADGTVEIATDATLIDLDGVAAAAAQRLNNDLGTDTKVACDGSVVVSIADTTFGCTATDGFGVERQLVVTILDDTGSWSVDLAR